MGFNYDISNPDGQVRLLVGDVTNDGHLFEDAEIAALLALNGDDVRLAAAQGLEVIAANQVMVLKVISLQGLSTGGDAVARELRQQAASLRSQVESGISDPSGLFDIAEFAIDDFQKRELLANRLLRLGL